MTSPIRFCLVLHNHQPVGNFEYVFEQAFQQSYLPFLDVFERYDNLCLSLHISGPLVRWLDEHHAAYLDRIKTLATKGRIEIIGGAYYEPILTMLPRRDRIGQISTFTDWLQSRFDTRVRGMWVAERVWESALTADLAQAGIQYTVLDDFHFRHGGLTEEQLHGNYVTEDAGQMIRVFPGSERLRYLIPFADPQQTIDYLRDMAQKHPGTVIVFGDDGEKFGSWPDTYQHVYEDGWLERFFEALDQNRDWLMTSTLCDAVETTPPNGKVFLPDASYREMTEWALPVERQIEIEQLKHELAGQGLAEKAISYIRGGFWRNFKVRYPETNEMYARMMFVSKRLQQAEAEQWPDVDLNAARDHLYRGQCNCAYWHGAFGGLYLPHLRNAIFHELIAAENELQQADEREASWTHAQAEDFDFDGRPEIRLANNQLVAWFAPAVGGCIYELDIRSICHNLLATIDRRPEAYHEKVKLGEHQQAGEAASIHDRVVFKQEGLDQRLQYDSHRRKSLIDHFWDDDLSIDQLVNGNATERGDFANGNFQSKIRRGSDRVQVQLTRAGTAAGLPLTLTKAVTMLGGSSRLEIAYLITGLPQDRTLHFASEFNFAGLPAAADDRYFHFGDHEALGQLQTELELPQVPRIHLCDQWLGIDVGLSFSIPSSVWTFPIQTVSQSEAGFELVHQSVVVQPHWQIRGDEQGQWSVKIELELDTKMAQSRMQNDSALAAT